ncbi:flagellar biosynthesis anti-sigma factor FlgM [Alteribacter natronophilus]|uniref:flagellar biosynthesis anti-sigma factor FlgM n=1 Tax=Alteribacter natronophilus TaxID=2583810 RepID=UPI00110F462F|nr:flagellar biosynthesis anti-sigma factor FlgM [Alteribacter natronophilus]TMW72372.1 flagellar biosynthesis anti-sigma factor FlgM [Alteribacter natronophilus]
MKINPYQPIQHYQNQMKGRGAEKEPEKAKTDEVQISHEAKTMQKDTVASPERLAKTEEIRQKIANGTYDLNHKETARKMYEFWGS